MTDDEITAVQLRLRPLATTPRTVAEFARVGRWWLLEAKRGYASSAQSARYARNMRWAAELAHEHGPGTWQELITRAGVRNPER